MELAKVSEICFLDVETTGLNPDRGDRIIEISMLKTSKNEKLITFLGRTNPNMSLRTIRINPEGKKSSKAALNVHNIKDKDLVGCGTFKDQSDHIIEFIDRKYIVAHNANFDKSFLENELKRIDKSIDVIWIDSIALLKRYYPFYPKYNLEYLSKIHGLHYPTYHSAEQDVQNLATIYINMYLNHSGNYFPTPFGCMSWRYIIMILIPVSLALYINIVN